MKTFVIVVISILFLAGCQQSDGFETETIPRTIITTDGEVDDEAALRLAVGRTWSSGADGFGRSWTPMLELLSSRELHSGADTNFDLAPQVQVSLSRRQHVLLNAGVRFPVNNSQDRDKVWGVYLLWDWFDGGFTEGW